MDPGKQVAVQQIVLANVEARQDYQHLKHKMEEANRLGLYDLAITYELAMSEMKTGALTRISNNQPIHSSFNQQGVLNNVC